jgi:DNA-binding LacI/PurR family transcriptional regulator
MIRKVSRKPTILTVAAKARVAPTTISRVLNGGYVSAEVRSRVQSAIKSLGYVPSSTARSLKYGRKGCVGVAVESVYGPWFMGLLSGIEDELAKAHLSVMLGGLKVHGTYDATRVASWISERRIDGLIFARYTRKEQPLLDAAREVDLPVTFVCPDEAQTVGLTVRCRNFDAGRAVGTYLLGLGHRRLGFAGGPRDSIDTVDRLRGLRHAIEQAGGELPASEVSYGATYDDISGTAAAADFLRRTPADRPTAVVLGNDLMALVFMHELLQNGVHIPADVSVVGFDGVDEGARFWPSLTTVVQPMQTLGSTACRGLLDKIEGVESEAPSMTVEYPMELVVRNSSGPAPAGPKRATPARKRS